MSDYSALETCAVCAAVASLDYHAEYDAFLCADCFARQDEIPELKAISEETERAK